MKKWAVKFAVLGATLGLLLAGSGASLAGQLKKPNAFEKFRQNEIVKFQQFARSLSKQQNFDPVKGREQIKKYARGMVERFEQFRDSKEGTPFALDVNRELVAIAVYLLEDDKKVADIVASVKSPKDACELKLYAGQVYGQRGNADKAKQLITEVLKTAKGKYPKIYKQAEDVRFQVAPQGLAFPEFPEGTKDLDGKPIKIADYKGKVVLVDFWATWSGPCIRDLPNVIGAYKKYHPKGFEIIGVSLDRSKDALTKVMKEKGITWRQYFDGQGWANKVSTRYGINAIPAMYLIGPDGKVVTNDVRGGKLEKHLEKLLGKVETAPAK